jgi:RHS repeat-associated protein
VFSRSTAADTQTPLVDGLGSTLAVTDAAGNVQTEYSYDAFGNTTAAGAASSYPFQYAGRENDGTGLYHNRARYYAPGLQRFVSQDPMGFGTGVNHYAYVGNNPVNFIDPLGLDGGNPFLDGLQTALDIGGMIPGIGEPLDLINSGISLARGDYAGAALSMAAAVPLLGEIAGAAKIGNRAVREGVYEVVANSGKTYVGQSGDIERRLLEHVRSGKVSPEEAARAVRTEVPGGKTAREISEQRRIDELGGIQNLENKVNPIGPNRQHLMGP